MLRRASPWSSAKSSETPLSSSTTRNGPKLPGCAQVKDLREGSCRLMLVSDPDDGVIQLPGQDGILRRAIRQARLDRVRGDVGHQVCVTETGWRSFTQPVR